jgi:UDP-MurNAc hydroxylase
MRFTVIGHACLFIDTGSERILVDPWLSGSCYWRSWWHFPPNTPVRKEFLEPDYVWLSHHHFDHFHYPSLRRISKKAQVLIPRFGVTAQSSTTSASRAPPSCCTATSSPCRADALSSYAYFDRTTVWWSRRDGVVLADFNDCKIKAAVRPMLKTFGAPKFLFKSHSFAQAYPNCYAMADPADAQLMTREDFLETFLDALRELRPAYAIPFASMVAFLHPESRQCNIYAVRPPEVAAVAAAADVGATTRTVLMVPGDTWSSDGGFALQPNDYYEQQDQWIERLAQGADAKIRQEEAAERSMTLTFKAFEQHFGGFLRSLPPLIWLVLKRPMVFEVPSDPLRYWVLDFRTRTVRRLKAPRSMR